MTSKLPIVFTTNTRIVKITAGDIDELADYLCSPDDRDELIDKMRRQAVDAWYGDLYDKWLHENPWAKPSPQGLDNSIPLDINLWSDAPAVESLVSSVFEALSACLGGVSVRHKTIYKTSIKVVILNLLAAYKRESEKYVACSLNPSFYKASSRYNVHNISGIIVDVIKAMAKTDFIGDLAKGFYYRATKQGKLTRIRAGLPLIEAFEKILALDPEASLISRHHEEIVLKLPKSEQKLGLPKTMEFKDNTVIPRRRNAVRKVNKRLQKHEICLVLNEDLCSLLAWVQSHRDRDDIEIDAEEIPHFNTANDRIYRTYNDGSFKRGGRFYGHWVQSIPARVYPFRSHLTIDGEPTVELDYSNLHPRMLYDMKRKTSPTGDLYALDGVDPAKRPVVKKLLNAMLNADNLGEAIHAVWSKPPKGFEGTTKAEVEKISEKIHEKHEVISHHFNTGIGLTLQYKDSTIAEGIMLELDKKGIICIPIHDSFIVQAKHEEALREAMVGQYRQVMKNEPPEIDRKKSNSSHPLLNNFGQLDAWGN